MHPTALPVLRDTLAMLPFDWILWAIDAEGTLRFHDGPGMRHKAMEPGHGVGRDVREMNRANPRALEFVEAVLAGPASGWVTFGETPYFVQGAPMQGGGAVAISLPCLVAAAGADEAEERDAPAPPVIEVARPIPELGAEVGDLLVFDPESPAYAGLFRRLWIGELPAGLLDDLSRVSRERDGAPSAAPRPPADGSGSPPERPFHLRLLP